MGAIIFRRRNIPIRQTAEEEEKRQYMFDSLAVGTSFTQMLMDQARETDLVDEQRGIAELIIATLDRLRLPQSDRLRKCRLRPVCRPEKTAEVLKVVSVL